jgi:hypothetical protein
MALQIRRGTNAERLTITPLQGELIYTTDTKGLFIGDGTTAGGVQVVSGGGGGTGTVTNISVVSANGLAGTVANATTTPAITLRTSVTGLLKGNGTAISAAEAGTDYQEPLTVGVDYQAPITLTTTGTSGAATLIGNVLNIPQYEGGSGGGEGASSLNELSDVSITGVIADQILKYNGTSWINSNLSIGIDDITGFSISSPSEGQFLKFDGANWINGELGDVSTSVISSPTDIINIDARLNVNQISTFNAEQIFVVNNSTDTFVLLSNSTDVAESQARLNFRRSRGTFSDPTDVLKGDHIGNISFSALAQGSNAGVGLIRAVVDEDVRIDGAIPGRIEFLTTSNINGQLTRKLYIDSRNAVRCDGIFQVYTSIYDPTPFTWFQQSHAVPDARNIAFIRTRGTLEAPLPVQNNDDIIDFQFSANTTTGSNDNFAAAAMTVKIDSAVSVGDARGRFEFATYNGTSLANRVIINSAGLLTANNGIATANVFPQTGNGDIALDTATAGNGTVNFKVPQLVAGSGSGQVDVSAPATFIKIKVNGTEYAIPAYSINP